MSLSQFQKDNLYKGLGLFIDGFRPYVVAFLQGQEGDKWPATFVKALSPAQQNSWNDGLRAGTSVDNLIDFQYLRSFAIHFKVPLRADFDRKVNDLPNWLGEITDVRHKIAHFQAVDKDDATKAWIHMKSIAKALGMGELEAELQKLMDQASATAAALAPAPSHAASGPQPVPCGYAPLGHKGRAVG
jgi:hypothetical protein